jgi:hypothetical protein
MPSTNNLHLKNKSHSAGTHTKQPEPSREQLTINPQRSENSQIRWPLLIQRLGDNTPTTRHRLTMNETMTPRLKRCDCKLKMLYLGNPTNMPATKDTISTFLSITPLEVFAGGFHIYVSTAATTSTFYLSFRKSFGAACATTHTCACSDSLEGHTRLNPTKHLPIPARTLNRNPTSRSCMAPYNSHGI